MYNLHLSYSTTLALVARLAVAATAALAFRSASISRRLKPMAGSSMNLGAKSTGA